MKPLPLSRIAQWTGGRLHGEAGRDLPAQDLLIDAVVTDTRVFGAADAGIDAGALFVALHGERFDGHAHVRDAAELGARAALVARVVGDAQLPQIVVADTERALGSLAAALQHGRASRVVAITGSNGKTSVKTLTLAILERAGRAYANPGNRNNEIGLPLAVIDAPEDAEFAIYEMGAGKPDDIAYLTSIARPAVALVNNIAPAHLERLGTLDGIADTKAAIYDALPADGVAVINADDAYAAYFAARAQGRRIVRYGFGEGVDLRATGMTFDDERSRFTLHTPLGAAAVALPMVGRHNIANALAAASLAVACGASLDDIATGLAEVRPVAGRLVRHRLATGAVLIDDSYNANPGSLQAAIDTLASASGENWLVLGDMRELGPDAPALHARAGSVAKAAGIARLYTIGSLSARAAQAFGAGARSFDSHDALIAALRSELHGTVRVLVKGSRGSAMDRVVKALLATSGPHDSEAADAA